MTFLGAKMPYSWLFEASKWLDLPTNGPLGDPGGALKVQKWVSDVYPVSIDQLDNYVVFGTKSDAEEDFQRRKKCLLGVKQNPFDQRWPP